MLEILPKEKGTYVLWLRCDKPQTIRVGRLGEREFTAAWYAYIGSAFGPGGLRARLNHHLKVSSRPHWHVDYLRQHMPLHHFWYCSDPLRREALWVEVFHQLTQALAVAAIGASDSKSDSHCFQFSQPYPMDAFVEQLHAQDAGHSALIEMITPG